LLLPWLGRRVVVLPKPGLAVTSQVTTGPGQARLSQP
jgi:hypothetical protein